MAPTIGRIVHYRLTQSDAEAIAKALPTAGRNYAAEDHYYPAMVVAVFGNGEHVNLKVFLDGGPGAEYWATSRPEGDMPGTWTWPPRV
ncbi:MAG: hypothetical protein HOV79_00565 [Hamadaea sp.]|nr:hypothetical protein [Hamadaea sp.]